MHICKITVIFTLSNYKYNKVMDYLSKLTTQQAATIIARAAKFGFYASVGDASFKEVLEEAVQYMLILAADYRTLAPHPKVGEIILDGDFERTICILADKDGDTTGLGIHLESAQLVRYYFPQS